MTCRPEASPCPKRVLFVLDHFHPFVGGAETLFRELSKGLVARGHDVMVVTLREPGTAAEETLDGLKIHRVRTPCWAARYWFILLALPTVLRLARGVDLIHTAGYAAAVPAWLGGRWLRKQTVLTVYEVLADQWQSLTGLGRPAAWICRVYEWLVLHLPFDRFVCISHFTAGRLRRLAGVPDQRISVVYPAVDYAFWTRDRHNPIDLRRRLGLADGSFVYLFFGRPGASKGVDTLVAAASTIAAALPDSRLVLLLAREPAEGRRQIVRQIRQRRLEHHVTVLDPVPREELPGHLLAADCVVVPSLSEGFGYAAIEAASLGCAVVATRGHAVEEAAGDHVVLAPPGDPAGLASSILRVASHGGPAEEMSQRFTLSTHIEETLAAYAEAASSRRPRPGLRAGRRGGEAGVSVAVADSKSISVP